ncbi:MAG: hypothetical protein NVV82_15825 [Sporocytophaga sp.]|nr:hypothetical protein [Sporocytophaga sp.]
MKEKGKEPVVVFSWDFNIILVVLGKLTSKIFRSAPEVNSHYWSFFTNPTIVQI